MTRGGIGTAGTAPAGGIVKGTAVWVMQGCPGQGGDGRHDVPWQPHFAWCERLSPPVAERVSFDP